MVAAVLGPVDHVAYLARELDAGVDALTVAFGAEIIRRFEVTRFDVAGAFLGQSRGPDIEVFTYTDEALLEARSAGVDLRLDHVAYVVADIEASARRLGAAGMRFSGPDLRTVATKPYAMGSARQLWTYPDRSRELGIQLIERTPAAAS